MDLLNAMTDNANHIFLQSMYFEVYYVIMKWPQF